MGKKGSWISAVKRVLSFEQKDKKDQKTIKSKETLFEKQKSSDDITLLEETSTVDVCAPAPPALPSEDVNSNEAENGQNKDAHSVALATLVDAEAAAEAAQAAEEVVHPSAVACYPGKSNEEISAIMIQTAFRGHLARRELRGLRGQERLKSLIQGQSVKRQVSSTLRCMQTLARVQSQIRARRIRMSEENLALQRQLQQKHEKEDEKSRALKIGEQWDHRTQSKEQVKAKMQHKQEAAIRREKALAYASSHQQTWKNPSKSAKPTSTDPNNPHWGWSWLDRWMAARPWESRSAIDYNDLGSDPTTAYKLSRPSSLPRSSSNTPSKAQSTSSATERIRSPSPKGTHGVGDDDPRSNYSMQSEQYRRHSIEGSSIRDNESHANSPSVTSYPLARSESDKARSSLPSTTGLNRTTPEKRSVGSAKKQLSFPPSPAGPRQHSGPSRAENGSIKDVKFHTAEKAMKRTGSGRNTK